MLRPVLYLGIPSVKVTGKKRLLIWECNKIGDEICMGKSGSLSVHRAYNVRSYSSLYLLRFVSNPLFCAWSILVRKLQGSTIMAYSIVQYRCKTVTKIQTIKLGIYISCSICSLSPKSYQVSNLLSQINYSTNTVQVILTWWTLSWKCRCVHVTQCILMIECHNLMLHIRMWLSRRFDNIYWGLSNFSHRSTLINHMSLSVMLS